MNDICVWLLVGDIEGENRSTWRKTEVLEGKPKYSRKTEVLEEN
jgi:hypothetical protein